MRSRAFWICVLVGCLVAAGGPRLGWGQDGAESEGNAPQEAPPEAGTPVEEAAPPESSGHDSGAMETESDEHEPSSAGTEPPAESDGEPETDATDESDEPDPDRPGRLLISTDSECNVFIDGQLEGRATPGERLEVAVKLGEIELRATATDVPGATWEKTVEMPEAQVEAVRVKMKRAIRAFRKEERQSGIYRDQKTLLMWPKRDNGRDVDLRKAYAYCRDLRTGGFENWRLPTLEQLKSLEAIWGRGIYKIRGEIVLSECCVWSSDYDGSARAATFNYRFRQVFQTNAGFQIGLRALCVRDWDPESDPVDPEENPTEK